MRVITFDDFVQVYWFLGGRYMEFPGDVVDVVGVVGGVVGFLVVVIVVVMDVVHRCSFRVGVWLSISVAFGVTVQAVWFAMEKFSVVWLKDDVSVVVRYIELFIAGGAFCNVVLYHVYVSG